MTSERKGKTQINSHYAACSPPGMKVLRWGQKLCPLNWSPDGKVWNFVPSKSMVSKSDWIFFGACFLAVIHQSSVRAGKDRLGPSLVTESYLLRETTVQEQMGAVSLSEEHVEQVGLWLMRPAPSLQIVRSQASFVDHKPLENLAQSISNGWIYTSYFLFFPLKSLFNHGTSLE